MFEPIYVSAHKDEFIKFENLIEDYLIDLEENKKTVVETIEAVLIAFRDFREEYTFDINDRDYSHLFD